MSCWTRCRVQTSPATFASDVRRICIHPAFGPVAVCLAVSAHADRAPHRRKRCSRRSDREGAYRPGRHHWAARTLGQRASARAARSRMDCFSQLQIDARSAIASRGARSRCVFRRRAIERLAAANIPYRIAATSASLNGLSAALLGGLGVTARTALNLPEGLVLC